MNELAFKMQTHFYVAAALSGVFLHSIVFSRHEWDRHAPRILYSIYISYATIVVLLATTCGFSFSQSLAETPLLGAALLGGLVSSMLTYRLFLHPLKSFPGPLCARLTSFWIIKQNVPHLNLYVKLRSLHDEYGDFVRIRRCQLEV
jgi:tryprostatin B 6-hydroxylase